jgi:phosphatidylinositol-3-phosphatase
VVGKQALRVVTLLLAGVLAATGTPANGSIALARIPRPAHTVVVIMENHSYSSVIGNGSAPYINSLRTEGANFTNSHGVAHPSEPNYLALFEGTTENLSDDSCPHTYSAANLASELLATGQTFVGFSESMPSDGYTGCTSGRYARKHNAWVNFRNVPASSNLTFGSFPMEDFGSLPSVAYVAPNLCNDMHDCSVATGDAWLRSQMDAYVQWAKTHNSLFILTFDESDSSTNQIPTIFVGSMVQPGDYGERVDHYRVLRTLEEMYGIPATGLSASSEPIASAWLSAPPADTPTPSAPGVVATPTPIPRAPVILIPRPPLHGPTPLPLS